MKNFTKHFIYWILPVLVVLPCILIYFFDFNGLARYIAPAINREFGIIENLQLALLVGIFIFSIKGIRRKKGKIEKYAWSILAFAAALCFFEEIDYGLHYFEYAQGKTKEQVDYQIVVQHQVRNFHNIGHMNSYIKFLVYACTIILFVILPLLPEKTMNKYKWVKFFAPSRYIIGTAIVMFFLNQTAQYLNTIFYSQNLALAGNTSEFEEIMIYYIFLLYTREMARKPLTVPAQKWNIAYLCGLHSKAHE